MDPRIDINSGDFAGRDLRGVDLSGLELTDANFAGADLREANLDRAILINPNFDGADLSGLVMREGYIAQGSFQHTTMVKADLRGTPIEGSYFEDAVIDGSDLSDTTEASEDAYGAFITLRNCSMRHVNLEKAYLSCSTFERVNLEGASLKGADLSYSDLSDMSFTGADLTGVTILGSTVAGANFAGALFASIESANLIGEPAGLPEGWKIVDGSFQPSSENVH